MSLSIKKHKYQPLQFSTGTAWDVKPDNLKILLHDRNRNPITDNIWYAVKSPVMN